MYNTVNNLDNQYAEITPDRYREKRRYSCHRCGELVSDRYLHNDDHRRRSSDPVIVFAKMSEIVTILWG